MIKFHAINPALFQASVSDQLDGHTDALHDHKEVYLRRAFDSSLTDTSAVAVIQLAEREGLHCLAHDLKQDFYSVTGKEFTEVTKSLNP